MRRKTTKTRFNWDWHSRSSGSRRRATQRTPIRKRAVISRISLTERTQTTLATIDSKSRPCPKCLNSRASRESVASLSSIWTQRSRLWQRITTRKNAWQIYPSSSSKLKRIPGGSQTDLYRNPHRPQMTKIAPTRSFWIRVVTTSSTPDQPRATRISSCRRLFSLRTRKNLKFKSLKRNQTL